MTKDKISKDKSDDPNRVAIKCSRCGHMYAKFLIIPSEEGVRQYSCEKCRNTWTVKIGGPIFNFLPSSPSWIAFLALNVKNLLRATDLCQLFLSAKIVDFSFTW